MIRSQSFRRILPLAVTFGLLGCLVSWVSPRALIQAAAELEWTLLLPATALMVVALYLWDAACLPLVYSVADRRISYLQSLHLRGLTYLGGALNYELGQAALAWCMARAQNTSLMRMLSRTILLAYHDILVLLGMALLGSLLINDPRVDIIRPYIAIAFATALTVGVLYWALPIGWKARYGGARAQALLEGWNVRRSLRLMPLRLIYFGILVTYATVALAICELPVDQHVVLSTVPLVLLADGLPNFAGLGTREATLQLLLAPQQPAVLLAMSLFWSTGMIIGRAVIGLAHLWGDRLASGSAAATSEVVGYQWGLRKPGEEPS